MTPGTIGGAGWLLGVIAAIWITWLAIVVAFVLFARRVTATPWQSVTDLARDDSSAADGLLVQRPAEEISDQEILAALSRHRDPVAASTGRAATRARSDAVGIFPRLEAQPEPGASSAAHGQGHVY